jgi:5-methylcytosine-specific restriction endonuclease McrA
LEKHDHRKRARKFNCEYDSKTTLKAIRDRDGTKCLICGKKVKAKNLAGYHKDNATIGHIIAMSNGGSHTMSNVQLECMECNTKKGVKNSGQLRLF